MGCWVWTGVLGTQDHGLMLLSPCREALKVILVCFERQLGSQWYWLSLQVKEMALRKVGGLALWDFLDFIVRTRIPIFVLLRPFIQCKVCCVFSLRDCEPRARAAGQVQAGLRPRRSRARGCYRVGTVSIMPDGETSQKCIPQDKISC